MRAIILVPAPAAWRCVVPHGCQQWAWAIVGGLATLDGIWSIEAGLTVHRVGLALMAAIGLLALSAMYRRRSRSLADTAETAALWVAFSAAGCVFSYLCASLAQPLQDAALADLDHAAGFDWHEWTEFVLSRPTLHVFLSVVYASLLPQILLSILHLPASGRAERNAELLLLAVVTLIGTCVVAAIWPSIGPSAEFDYVPDLLAAREPGPWIFDLWAMHGIVAMPSYHTTLAVLFTYAYRGTGAIGWGIAALNLAMLPSIPPIGGHYLVDVIAGAAIAGLAIGIARCSQRLHRPAGGWRSAQVADQASSGTNL